MEHRTAKNVGEKSLGRASLFIQYYPLAKEIGILKLYQKVMTFT